MSEKKSGRILCDESRLASGVVDEINGVVVEYQRWLRKKDGSSHINFAELVAVFKWISFADKWNLQDFKYWQILHLYLVDYC